MPQGTMSLRAVPPSSPLPPLLSGAFEEQGGLRVASLIPQRPFEGLRRPSEGQEGSVLPPQLSEGPWMPGVTGR